MPNPDPLGLAAVLACVALLSGCGHPWPEAGRGGLAERTALYDEDLARTGEAIAIARQGIAEAPARVAIAEDHWVLAVREYATGLYADADASAVSASVELGGTDLDPFGVAPRCLRQPCR